ncbi:puromycin-sensitive aminopeptidase-like [Physella acuta]|uniref:puromycin-sensitive aminopeptidase-like n=1 Tax=Physella acuta TaxID=109671 RepID=UPI0027DD8B3C|nr:puromycin-sensitive aminopeptidase-like [Physella acuta]
MCKTKEVFERLPSNVVPTLYRVTLQPDLQLFTFKGSEEIAITVKSATNKIVLNIFDIIVHKAHLIGAVDNTASIHHNHKDEKVELVFQQELSPGEYCLQLEFTGNLNDQLRGFYRNKYTTSEGEIRYAAGTHFEATGARRAYPCWDEPAIKAVFIFTLVVPVDRVAFSNMPVENEKVSPENSGLKIVTFQPTPIMSTYLTAFVVGEYDFVEDVTSNGIPVRVYTPSGRKEHGRFALEIATKALSYYEWYFDIPYGLPKLDLITLPEFAIGAMENWGLITYRETALLVNPNDSSASSRQYVALVVAHELSHNWFGNLVTMEWWTDLWLKEGFATWIEYLCVDHLHPEFDIWLQFIKIDQCRALELDALSNSHAVEVQVGHPGEIDEIFDEISYCKGACLIRMLQSFIGDEAFRKGMKLYLNKHKFGNTRTKDMWDALSESSGMDISRIMDTWTKQMGFPLIKVEEVIVPNSDIRQVILSQEKFCSRGRSDSGASQQRWIVPFSITTAHSPTKPAVKGLLEGDSLTIDVPHCKPDDWIKVNSGQYMFYHVQYQFSTLNRLMPAVKQNIISPEDKIGLLTDLFALCKSNYMETVDVLKLTESFREEQDSAVCGKLALGLSGLRPLVQQITLGQEKCFKALMCRTFERIGENLSWEASDLESHSFKLMREQVLLILGRYGNKKTVTEAFKRFEDHCTGSRCLDADLKTPVYATVLANGDKQVFDKLLEIYNKEESLVEKNRIARMLGSVLDESLISQVLEFALSDKVRIQDSIEVLRGATGSIKGRERVWEFVQQNWQELYQRYGTSTMLSRLVRVVTDGVCCTRKKNEIEKFFETHKAESAQRSVQQGLEHISTNIAFVNQQGPALLEYLNNLQ